MFYKNVLFKFTKILLIILSVSIFNFGFCEEEQGIKDSFAIDSGAFTGVFNTFQTVITEKADKIATIAKSLLFSLAIISLFYNSFKLIFGNDDYKSLFSELLKFIFFIGFCVFILQFGMAKIFKFILDFPSIIELSNNNHFDTSSPFAFLGSLFKNGWRIFYLMVLNGEPEETPWNFFPDAGDFLWIFKVLVRLVLGLIILLLFVFIAFDYMLNIIKIYFTIACGILAVGFAGLTWTNQWAINYAKQIVKYGIELFVITFIIVVGVDTIITVVNNFYGSQSIIDTGKLLTVTLLTVLIWIASTKVPHAVLASLEGGVSNTSYTNIAAVGMAMASKSPTSLKMVKALKNRANSGNSGSVDLKSALNPTNLGKK